MVKSLKLFSPKRQIETKRPDRRASRHERGYDSQWDRVTASFRRKNPICAECERDERIIPMDVIDHKVPVTVDPELRLDPRNWWALCHDCHNGFKRRMEAYAARTGQADKLILWCDDPTARPQSFKGKPKKQEGLRLIV